VYRGARQPGATRLHLELPGRPGPPVRRSCSSPSTTTASADSPRSCLHRELPADLLHIGGRCRPPDGPATPLLEGLIAGVTVIPWTETENPEVVAFQRALEKVRVRGSRPTRRPSSAGLRRSCSRRQRGELPDPPHERGPCSMGLWRIRQNDLNGPGGTAHVHPGREAEEDPLLLLVSSAPRAERSSPGGERSPGCAVTMSAETGHPTTNGASHGHVRQSGDRGGPVPRPAGPATPSRVFGVFRPTTSWCTRPTVCPYGGGPQGTQGRDGHGDERCWKPSTSPRSCARRSSVDGDRIVGPGPERPGGRPRVVSVEVPLSEPLHPARRAR